MKPLIACLVAMFLFSCEQSQKFTSERTDSQLEETDGSFYTEEYSDFDDDSETVGQPSAPGLFSSYAAVEHVGDTTRKLIRMADIKFRVNDVGQSTREIENLVMELDGFVESTVLRSFVNNQRNNRLSSDSILETTYFTVYNIMTLRVPSTNLQLVLTSIAKEIDFLDHRSIQAKNVALEILSNQLKQTRAKLAQEQKATVTDRSDSKVSATTTTTTSPLHARLMVDEARLALLRIEDQVKYSTIELEIYERQRTSRRVLPDDKSIKDFKPGFFSRLRDAFGFGLNLFVEFLLVLLRLWVLILLAVLAWLVYSKYRIRKK